MTVVQSFTLHGSSGINVLDAEFLNWLKTHSPDELGAKIVAYSWQVGNQRFEVTIDIGGNRWSLLPDSSGFISFNSMRIPNNCKLLDVFGKERSTLNVPWQLTRPKNPASNAPPTSFSHTSSPYINPANNKLGEFGVKAWVELAGEYYFELDWKTGEFLWGREIRV